MDNRLFIHRNCWLTQDGEVLRPHEMATPHLLNALNLAIRKMQALSLRQGEVLHDAPMLRLLAILRWPVLEEMERTYLDRLQAEVWLRRTYV